MQVCQLDIGRLCLEGKAPIKPAVRALSRAGEIATACIGVHSAAAGPLRDVAVPRQAGAGQPEMGPESCLFRAITRKVLQKESAKSIPPPCFSSDLTTASFGIAIVCCIADFLPAGLDLDTRRRRWLQPQCACLRAGQLLPASPPLQRRVPQGRCATTFSKRQHSEYEDDKFQARG